MTVPIGLIAKLLCEQRMQHLGVLLMLADALWPAMTVCAIDGLLGFTCWLARVVQGGKAGKEAPAPKASASSGGGGGDAQKLQKELDKLQQEHNKLQNTLKAKDNELTKVNILIWSIHQHLLSTVRCWCAPGA